MMKSTLQFMVLASIISAMGACAVEADTEGQSGTIVVAQQPSRLGVADRTFEVLGVQVDLEAVDYRVRTPMNEHRVVRYDRDGHVDVLNSSGMRVNLVEGDLSDRLLSTLELPSHDQIGYAALGIGFPLPVPVSADALEQSPNALMAAKCVRVFNERWTNSDGCTYGMMVDDCGDTTYVMSYAVESSGCSGAYASETYR